MNDPHFTRMIGCKHLLKFWSPPSLIRVAPSGLIPLSKLPTEKPLLVHLEWCSLKLYNEQFVVCGNSHVNNALRCLLWKCNSFCIE